MKASNDKKVEIAKEILVAYISHSPEQARDVDSVCAAAKRIFETVDSIVETIEPPKEQAGFRL
ncbi:MAG: hypothetical protein ACM3US_04530 [Sphingomonadaceae bacterium]